MENHLLQSMPRNYQHQEQLKTAPIINNIKKNKVNYIINKMLQNKELQQIRQQLMKQAMLQSQVQDHQELKETIRQAVLNQGLETRLADLANNCKKQMIIGVAEEREEKTKVNVKQILDEKKIEWTNSLYDVLVDLSKNKDIQEKYIYDYQRLFEFLSSIQKEEKINLFMQEIRKPQIIQVLGFQNVYQELKEKYQFLRKKKQMLDLDSSQDLIEQKEIEFEDIIASEFEVEQLREYLKFGVPNTKRVELYLNLFEVEEYQRSQVTQILEELDNHSFARFFEQIIIQDVKEAMSSDLFFQFDEIIQLILKIFFKDIQIINKIKTSIYDDVFSDEEKERITIHGIIPFKGISKMIGPFCYVSQNEEIIYLVFREFFTNYFYKLISISGRDEEIISLCNIFENLMVIKDEDLVVYLKNKDIKPMEIAFPWIFFCFIGYLELEQLFFLLDRITAFDSLKIVPVLAASIITSKKKQIKRIKKKQQILDLFSDLQDIVFIQQIRLFFDQK